MHLSPRACGRRPPRGTPHVHEWARVPYAWRLGPGNDVECVTQDDAWANIQGGIADRVEIPTVCSCSTVPHKDRGMDGCDESAEQVDITGTYRLPLRLRCVPSRHLC
ncbi:g8900 [Coccomyxa elongata]